MAVYRTSRNIEASLIDYLTDNFQNDGWDNITIEKSFNRAQNTAIKMDSESAVVCVRASSTNRDRIEIGSDSVQRSQLVLIDIFAVNDGQRLDLVDYIGDLLKYGCPFYEYITERNAVVGKTQNGRITVTNLEDAPVSFNVDKSSLDTCDRYRHLFTLTISLGKVEV